MAITGDKDELISRIVQAKRKKADDEEEESGQMKSFKKLKLLGDGSSSSSSSSSSLVKIEEKSSAMVVGKKVKLSAESLPHNMYSMSAPQLRSVCAANGLLHLIAKDASKGEIIKTLEEECYDDGEKKKVKDEESEDDASDASDHGDDDT